MAATIPAVSTEYIKGPVTASVDLDTQTVEVAFLQPTTAIPDELASWVAAEWIGSVGTTRSWRLLVGPNSTNALAAGQYVVWVRITDVTEQPVRKHDVITIT